MEGKRCRAGVNNTAQSRIHPRACVALDVPLGAFPAMEREAGATRASTSICMEREADMRAVGRRRTVGLQDGTGPESCCGLARGGGFHVEEGGTEATSGEGAARWRAIGRRHFITGRSRATSSSSSSHGHLAQ
jgi:hypothetical protein